MKRGWLLLALLWPGFGAARDTQLDGRVSLRGLYSADDAGGPAVGMVFLETDARAERLTEGNLRLALDATFLVDVTDAQERRFGRTESLDQVRQLYAEQPELAGVVDASVGRRLVFDAGHGWVDGLVLRLPFAAGSAAAGLYGGLSPDRFDYALTTEYQAAGAYGTFQREGFEGALAINTLLHEGKADRHWLFNRLHWRAMNSLYLATYLIVDFVESPTITTLLASLDYTPVPPLNFTLNFSRYSVEQYRDTTIYHDVVEPNQALLIGDEVVDLIYNRVRLSASIRFWGHYYHYQSVELKARTQDDREAWFYTLGLRDDDFLGWGTRLDLSTSFRNNFQSDSYLVALTAEHDLGGAFSLEGRLMWYDGRTIGRQTERGRIFDEAQEIVLFGGAVYWRPTKSHQIDVDYDGVYETELQDVRNQDSLLIHTLMGRYSYLF